ncbi:MAG TPA: thioredoxin family protein [bacterium]|nr:thioredoxin family protein [bacterium]
MNIKILGTGCPKCKKLEKIVRKVLEENNIKADLEKVTEMNDIMSYNVMMTPALVIDDEVKSSGNLPDKDKILDWLK